MIKIEYPAYRPKIKADNNHEFIFDTIRKRWVKLTPEEWVRQNFLQYLIEIKKYPATLVSVEKEIMLGELRKRYDIVVYKNTKPWMVIECKAMDVNLNKAVLDQVLRYNMALKVPYLIVTNGTYCFAFDTADRQLNELTDLPAY